MKKKLLLSLMGFLLVAGSGAFWKFDRVKDLALSLPVSAFMVMRSKVPLETKDQRDHDIKVLGRMMAWAFDSVKTASGDFDIHKYPYLQAMKIILGKKNRMFCGGISSLYAFALNQLGYQTRILLFAGPDYLAGKNRFDTHVGVEVFLPQTQKWVLADPTFDAFWSCDGKDFVDYSTLYDCLQNELPLSPIHLRAESEGISKLQNYHVSPPQVFHAGKALIRTKSYGPLSFFTSSQKDWWGKEIAYEYPRPGLFDETFKLYQTQKE